MRESLKPIEPGCLVLVKRGRHAGAVGRVEHQQHWPDHHCNACDSHDPWFSKYWSFDGRPGAICGCALMRIDPDDDQREEFEAEKKVDAVADVMSGYARMAGSVCDDD